MIPPAGDFPALDTDFQSRITVLGAEPVTAGWPFPAQLTIDLRDLTGGAATPVPDSVRLERSDRRMMSVTFAPEPGRASAVTRVVPSWYLRIAGRLRTTAPWTNDQLNHAISRALAQTIRWTGEVDPFYATRLPRDGGQLLARFRAENGCTGIDPLAVMAQGCTTLTDVPAPAPRVPPAPTACDVRTASAFWLRPRATFARTGPRYGAGTLLRVTQDTGLRENGLGLYAVTVGAARGFAALSARDLAGCANLPGVRPCDAFVLPRRGDLYERDARTRFTRTSLPAGTRVLLRARFTGTFPGLDSARTAFVVRVLDGRSEGREGVAAFSRAEIGCDPTNLPFLAA